MFDVAIIGAGIIGTFIARELSKYDLDIALIEKDNDISNGTTKANTAIIHAGYDAEPNTNKSKFNSLGNPMFDDICKNLDVEFERIGSLVVAFSEEEMTTLEELYERGVGNNIPKLKILDKKEVKKMEPNLSEDIVGALYAPTCGIIGPWELAIALCENAMENGVQLFLNSEVVNIEKEANIYKINTKDREFKSKYVINCGGLYADKINNMVSNESFEIKPRRGQYYLLDKKAGDLVNSVVFQCPTKLGKGVIVAPTVHGNLIVGPDAEDIDDKEALDTTVDSLSYIEQTSKKTCENIPFSKTITTFAGLRAETKNGDFIIEEAKDSKGFINVAGIKSPGLTASPAIAEYVAKMIRDMSGDLKENSNFNPKRKKVIRFNQLTDKEKKEIIEKDPKFGRIICRCENITEGEIVDCIHRKAGATTVDGVKRRVRPGSGRCQGGFCKPRVMEILSRELNENIEDIVKDGKKSYILTGKSNKGSDKGDLK